MIALDTKEPTQCKEQRDQLKGIAFAIRLLRVRKGLVMAEHSEGERRHIGQFRTHHSFRKPHLPLL